MFWDDLGGKPKVRANMEDDDEDDARWQQICLELDLLEAKYKKGAGGIEASGVGNGGPQESSSIDEGAT